MEIIEPPARLQVLRVQPGTSGDEGGADDQGVPEGQGVEPLKIDGSEDIVQPDGNELKPTGEAMSKEPHTATRA